ncbi:MAG: hypothetical protein WD552_01750 [Candidatus Paceibacterota bacterium]
MSEQIDLRTPQEKRRDEEKVWVKRIIKAAAVIVGFILLSGCTHLEEVADMADDSWDAVEDLTWTASDISRDVTDIKRAVTRAKYQVSMVNTSCADYHGEDEAGNSFRIPAGEITVITVRSTRRGDERVSLLLQRSDNRVDCRAPAVASGEIDRNNDEVLIR